MTLSNSTQASTPFAHQLLINNELVTGDGSSEQIINPRNGEELALIASASPEQVEAAIASGTRRGAAGHCR